MNRTILIISLLLSSFTFVAAANEARLCKKGHVAHSDSWKFCPVCGKKLPKISKMEIGKLFRSETVLGNKYINKKDRFTIERPSKEYSFTYGAAARKQNSDADLFIRSENGRFYVVVIAEQVAYEMTYILDFSDSNLTESFPRLMAVSEKEIEIAGLPAVEVIYTGSFDELSEVEYYYCYYAIIDKEQDSTYQISTWGPIGDFIDGTGKQTTKLILDSFTIIKQ